MSVLFRISIGVLLCVVSAVADEDRFATQEPTIQELIHRLDDDSFFVREETTELIIQKGKDAIKPLRKALNHPSAEVRSRAMLALGALERDVFYTISVDGRLFEISAGKTSVRKKLIARLGPPFEKDDTQVEGLAMSPADGMLYAAVSCFDANQCTSQLYRVDPAGRSVQLIGTMANTEIDGLAFDKNGALYGLASSEKQAQKAGIGQLMQIDPKTAKTQTIKGKYNLSDADALAISDEGIVAVSNGHSVAHATLNGTLQFLDQRSRHSVPSLTCQLGDFEGIAFDADSNILGLCRRCANSHLIRMNLATQKCQYLGPLGFGALNLARQVTPAPRKRAAPPNAPAQ